MVRRCRFRRATFRYQQLPRNYRAKMGNKDLKKTDDWTEQGCLGILDDIRGNLTLLNRVRLEVQKEFDHSAYKKNHWQMRFTGHFYSSSHTSWGWSNKELHGRAAISQKAKHRRRNRMHLQWRTATMNTKRTKLSWHEWRTHRNIPGWNPTTLR